MLENVVISNPRELGEKKKKIAEQRKEKFHVIADFDRTLTCSFFKGEKTPSLISHLRNGKYLTSDYAPKAHALFDKYHPIEINPDISVAEKNDRMQEWWNAHYKLLVESGLDTETMKQSVEDMIKQGKIRFRTGIDKFLKILNKNSIPLIIMSSAAIGDMILEFLKQQNLLFDNIHLIGNMMDFDEKGKFKGIKGKIIHSLNKREIEISELPIC